MVFEIAIFVREREQGRSRGRIKRVEGSTEEGAGEGVLEQCKAPRGEPEMGPSVSARAALFFRSAPPAAYLTPEVLGAQDRGAALVE